MSRWQEHAILPGGGDRDPLARQHVLPHDGGRGSRVEHAGIRLPIRAQLGVGVIEIDELSAVGEHVLALDDGGHSPVFLSTIRADPSPNMSA